MSIKLPYQQTSDRQFNQFQQALQSALAPVLNLPTANSSLLTSIALKAGANTVNHKLNRKLLGWYPVRVRADSVLWDSQDTNPNPTQTLILNCTADVTVDLIVF